VPTSVADAAPDAALDLTGRETVVTKKDNDRWIRAPWRACPTQRRTTGVAVSGSLRRAAEHRAQDVVSFASVLWTAPRRDEREYLLGLFGRHGVLVADVGEVA
jgi:hypothetical protein